MTNKNTPNNGYIWNYYLLYCDMHQKEGEEEEEEEEEEEKEEEEEEIHTVMLENSD